VGESSRALSEILETAGAASLSIMRAGGGPASDVETCVFENCHVNVVARCYAILFPRADPSNRVAMSSRHPLNAYDPRTGRLLGSTDQLAVELGPVEPGSACREEPLARPAIFGPRSTRLGGNAEFLIRSDAAGAVNLVHLDAIAGKHDCSLLREYLCHSERGREVAAILLERPTGAWKIRVRELLDSATEVIELHVEP
jgi:hypothetical protein